MPGVVGIIAKSFSKGLESELRKMVEGINHSPFLVLGHFQVPDSNAFLGWSNPVNGFCDCMPVWNERRDVCLVFSGEEFAEPSEISRLNASGHSFDPGNASYLVHLYEEKGLQFLNDLNGGFCGVLVDLREQKIIVFNDRYGLQRVHFHENQTGFYFSSEAKALLKVLPELRAVDYRSLGELVSCGAVLQNRSLFRGVELMPPASAWVFRLGQPPVKSSYFDVRDWESQPTLDAEAYYELLKETWTRILPRYFRGDARPALSLTGGVDSRMILAHARCAPGNLPCYTFGGRYRDCTDVKVSRKIAKISGQQHSILPIDQDFLLQFPSLAQRTVYLSDGTMDVTGAIDLHVQEAARGVSPVRVTGTNGGEILRSIVAFKPSRLHEGFFEREFSNQIQNTAKTYHQELRGNRLTFTAFKQAPWYMGSKFIVERSGLMLRMPYFDNDLVKLVYRAPASAAESNDVSLRLISDGNPELARIPTDRGVVYRPIPGIDRARNLFQEFLFKSEYAYDYGMPQWLAKVDHAVAPLHLERLFLGRHKFHHFRVFYRDELAGYVRDTLLDPRALGRPYLQRDVIEKMINNHIKGSANYTLEIHKLLTAELLQQQLIERDWGSVASKPIDSKPPVTIGN